MNKLRTPTLRQLRYFVSLAETLHFGEAALDCGVTQPNLSAQVQELERSLDSVLLERTTRQVLLTSAGEAVLEVAKRILDDVDSLSEIAGESNNSLSGRLRLGVIPTATPYILPPVLPLVRRSYPELELELIEDYTEPLVERLETGALDLLLIALPIDNDNLIEMSLAFEPFFFLTPANHPLAGAKHVSPSAFDPHELLLLQEGNCLRDQVMDFCDLARSDHHVIEGTSLTTLIQMVANGIGVTLLPQLAIAPYVSHSPETCVIPFSKPVPGRELGFVWRKSSNRQDAFLELGAIFSAQIEKLLANISPNHH